MITFFTTAKPFVGQIGINQMNALRSWKSLSPDVQVILFGDGVGYAQAADALGLLHVRNVDITAQGTPLVNSMFALARLHGRFPVKMYVNCDIILLDDLLPAIGQIKFDRFLMVGQRWNLELNQAIDFSDPDWRQAIRQRVQLEGHLHPPAGSDYFVYRRDIWQGIPTLVIGRGGYDNYLLQYCRKSHVPLIDASGLVTVVHQNHDYGHHPQGLAGVQSGVEAQLNLKQEAQLNLKQDGGMSYRFTPVDADWRLSPVGLTRNFARGDWRRYLQSQSSLYKDTKFGKFLEFCVLMTRILRRPNWLKGLRYAAKNGHYQ